MKANYIAYRPSSIKHQLEGSIITIRMVNDELKQQMEINLSEKVVFAMYSDLRKILRTNMRDKIKTEDSVKYGIDNDIDNDEIDEIEIDSDFKPRKLPEFYV